MAAAFGLFVCGITWISRDEARAGAGPGRRAGVVVGLLAQVVGLLGLLASAVLWILRTGRDPTAPALAFVGPLILLLTAGPVLRAGADAVREPIPARLQAAVKAGVLSLVWLDVGLVASARGPAVALAVAVLWLPAFGFGRWLYAT